MSINFYVTTLDSQASAVLGYDWLARHNPSIDWVSGQIFFRTPPATPMSTTPSDFKVPP